MESVLSIIENETGGQCFRSKKYSIDLDKDSSIVYDEEKPVQIGLDGETEPSNYYINLENKVNSLNFCTPLFKYFLDGSRKVYKVDDIVYNERVYPILTGQIGVGCCKREEKLLKNAFFLKENVIVLPKEADADDKNTECYFENLRNKINQNSYIMKKNNIQIDKILYCSPKKDQDYKDIATAKIQDRMIELEKELVSQIAKKHLLKEDIFLMKDGSLEYQRVEKNDKYEYDNIKNNYRSVVGISKTFNPSLAKLKNGKSMATFIAKLPLNHRTSAIMHSSSRTGSAQFAIWYVRIRKSDYCSSPFDGVLKVEKILLTKEEKENGLDTELINNISANLIKERNPVCYGTDKRWANHLYPIFLTESFIKSKYISNDFFLYIF